MKAFSVLLLTANACLPVIAQASWTPLGDGCNGGPDTNCIVQNDQNISISALPPTGETAIPIRNTTAQVLWLKGYTVFTSARGVSPVRVRGNFHFDASGPSSSSHSTPNATPGASGDVDVGTTPAWYTVLCRPPICIAPNSAFWVTLETGLTNAPNNSTGSPGASQTLDRPVFGVGPWVPSNAVPNPIVRLVCATGAGAVPYLTSLQPPQLGTTFALEIRDADPLALVAFIWSFQQLPTPLDLGFLGAPGCSLFINTDAVLIGSANVGGVATNSLAIPSAPALAGLNFFNQGVEFRSGANALGMIAANAGRGVVN